MAVTREDVLHIADLARLGVDETRAEELTKELTSILGHMEVLSQVDTAHVAADGVHPAWSTAHSRARSAISSQPAPATIR